MVNYDFSSFFRLIFQILSVGIYYDYKSKANFLFDLLCVHMCPCVCMSVHRWRLEAKVRSLLQSLPTLASETRSLTNRAAPPGQQAPGICLSLSPLPNTEVTATYCQRYVVSTWVLGIHTQVLVDQKDQNPEDLSQI